MNESRVYIISLIIYVMKKKQLIVLKVFSILLFANTASFLLANTVNIRVVFPFKVSNVEMHLWGSINQDFSLSQSGKNEFSTVMKGDIRQMMFYIDYIPSDYPKSKWYLSGGNSYEGEKIPNRFDAHGLKYGKIYINNQLIDNSYTVANNMNNGLNIYVKVNSDNSVSPLIDPTYRHIYIDDRIPTEVHHRKGYLDTNLPASYHRVITGWVQALSDNNIIDSSKIDVDYLRLYGRIGNDSVLIDSKEYDSWNSNDDGGLYFRYPFFPEGDEHTSMPAKSTNGVLTFYPSDKIDRVWHWWTGNKVNSGQFNFDSYKLICRLRIIGKAVVQAGIDFKTTENTINELGVSDWYFENNGEWQDVIFDTKKYTTTSLNSINALKKSDSVFSFVKDGEIVSVKFKDVEPGKYSLRLYNANGIKLLDKVLNFEYTTGSISVPFSATYEYLIYEINNQTNTYKGKIVL